MNRSKEKIENLLNSEEINQNKEKQLLDDYKKKYPKDSSIHSMMMAYWVKYGEYEQALKSAQKAYKINSHVIENNYNLVYAYELNGNYEKAYQYYMYTKIKQKLKEICIVEEENIEKRAENIKYKITNSDEFFKYLCGHQFLLAADPMKQLPNTLIGEYIYLYNGKKYYAGNADNWCSMYFTLKNNMSVFENKCELHEIVQIGKEYMVPGNKKDKYLVPVMQNPTVQKECNEIRMIREGNQDAIFVTPARQKFYYFPLHGGDRVQTYLDAAFGKPVPLQYKKENKRLVMSIFIDSLSGEILKDKEFQDCIPNIRRFFADGCECRNAFAGSEFTYPSMASYVSGLYPEHHQMLDSSVYNKLPIDSKILTELFKEQGYITAKIGGNDGTDSFLGYSRGVDRTCYQYYSQYPAEQVVSDVIEHIETFQETNQYVCIELADLHDVAGGFIRSLYVQKNTEPGYYVKNVNEKDTTTVKKGYNKNLIEIYKWELKKLDRNLGILFRDIEERYQPEEMVISLFSDHGTSFMVENEKPFLDRKRVNVPMMFRGGKVKKGICDEYIETVDYGSILCRLCGFTRDDRGLDGRLPEYFGGESRREYVYSRSFFPGDPYRAAIYNEDISFYLETKNPVSAECTIDFSEYHVWGRDCKGELLNDQQLKKYTEIVKDRIGEYVIY